ncbi:hypothetical protein HBH70_164980 [Parastagonospora nodorum]|nr:hypothetical protein HBI95_163930 [Parastagonospora nodorum]KAH4232462.1 hypothetical protein HBI05_172920 [Parastagonospora nodorum]KAH4855225.1 hypothetical protein HBH59_189150 [Parastagonospora nodorum]KAH4916600.1 hypothetical protein HBH74_140900 [Parastagonospora nodorum]KAH4927526.1 hypothetical protein HBH73_201760 [Parastagonospora nodorum]
MGKRRWARDDCTSCREQLNQQVAASSSDIAIDSCLQCTPVPLKLDSICLQTIVSATCSPLYASPLSHPVPLVNSCKPAIYSAGSYPRLRPNKCSRERTATRV